MINEQENMLRGVKNICGYRGILRSPPLLQVACNYTSSAITNKTKITLPKLPVPVLQHSLDKYLLTVKPFLNDTEFAKTVALVKDFEQGLGKKAQALLEKRAKEHVNWLEDWWLATAYLEFRYPVVIFSNAGLLFNTSPIKTQEDQLRCAAKCLLGTLEYKALIDNNKIPQIMMKKKPLDMQQFKKLFGTCRIPWEKRDKLSFNNSSRHVTVIHNEHVFHLDLWGHDNILLSEKQILEQLQKIVKNSESTNKQGIGILTSEHRDTWAKAYQLLSKDNRNRELLTDVQDSIVVLCLDAPCHYSKTSNVDTRRTLGEEQLVHGGGSMSNGGNRWFDKTIQIIVGADGLTGLNLEHAPVDGLPIGAWLDFLPKYLEQDKGDGTPSLSPKTPKRLDFNVTPEVASMIKDAKVNLDKIAGNLDIICFQYQKYGKNFIKSQKRSPDSFIQVAIQFAFYRLHKVPGAHYESATTAMFERGRTETIRSCSIESIEFAKAMLDTNKNSKEKLAALQNALEYHKKYAIEAVQGMGIDRHLLGLKLAAITNGLEVHEMYSDAGYIRSGHMRISTSQVALKTDAFICFGPTVPDGYGIWYNIRDSYINFALSAYKDNTDTSMNEYKNALEQSLQDMHDLLLQNTSSAL